MATVVSKLLLQAQPDIAIFGEKDYQQLLVVRRLVADLDIPVEIRAGPTLREADGLAMSSRNAYLSPDERRIAPRLHQTLQAAAYALHEADATPGDAIKAARATLEQCGFAVDYVELRDAETFAAVHTLERRARLLVAARLGRRVSSTTSPSNRDAPRLDRNGQVRLAGASAAGQGTFMLRVFVTKGACLSETDMSAGPIPPDASWVDLVDPTPEEVKSVEAAFKIVAPTRDEMREIEASSRLYVEDGATVMIATVVSGTEAGTPESNAVAFILAGGRLATVRHSSPKSFDSFPMRAARQPGLWESGERILVGLLEAIIDRTADILERASADIDTLSREIFDARAAKVPLDSGDFEDAVYRLGSMNDLVARVRQSLVSFSRLVTFMQPVIDVGSSKDLRGHIKVLSRDILSLSEHTFYLANKIQFLLDATLGLISIEQNKIIKVLAVVGTILGPPTLLASFWGMNFHGMSEYAWRYGYPFALAVIVISGLVPFLYFKWRHWF